MPAEFEAVGDRVGVDGLVARVRHTPTGIVLRLVEPGEFMMGTPLDEVDRDKDEGLRLVSIEEPFYLGETEVTVAQWRAVIGELPRSSPEQDHYPVGGVSWYRAVEFVDGLNASGAGGWRLPMEVEWEFACRAGTITVFPFGDRLAPELVNYDGRYPYADGSRGLRRLKAVPVGSLPPNQWGFHEMLGNHVEWCQDYYVPFPERGQRPRGRSGDPRVLRGGSWSSSGEAVRSGYREGYPPNSGGTKYGLRVARTVVTR